VSGLLAITFLAATVSATQPAGADPVSAASASGYGAHLTVAGQPLVLDHAGLEEATLAAPDPDVDPLVLVPAAPLAVAGVANGEATVHPTSDLPSTLTQVTQAVEGPYNARGAGTVAEASVLLGVPETGQALVSATAIRAEAVAVCADGTPKYSATSEIIDLELGGQDVPLNDPVTTLLTAIDTALEPLAQVADIGINEVSPDGRSVTALRVTVLQAEGGEPVAEVLLGHAEVGVVTCGGGAVPQCSDTTDNDGDGVIDANDPGCHTDGDPDNPDSYDPNDDDETDGGTTQCSDATDNDGDGVIDADDPGCHSDGNATNPDSYDPTDDDETDQVVEATSALPVTGAAVPVGLALSLGAVAAALEIIRRRALTA
jgi:hypothetical protein